MMMSQIFLWFFMVGIRSKVLVVQIPPGRGGGSEQPHRAAAPEAMYAFVLYFIVAGQRGLSLGT